MKKIQNIIFVSCFDPINLAVKQFIEEKISCYPNCTISLLPVSTYNSHLTKAVDKIEMLKICFEIIIQSNFIYHNYIILFIENLYDVKIVF